MSGGTDSTTLATRCAGGKSAAFFLGSLFAFHHDRPLSPDSSALLEPVPLLLFQTLPSFYSRDYEFQHVLDRLLSGLP
jgi:hypothetical protein